MRTLFVRDASDDDNEVISQHIALSREEANEYRGTLHQLDAQGETLSFVAGIGDTVMGSTRVIALSNGEWSITHIYVQREARNIGIGDSLMAALLRMLRARGATWISAQALPGDRAMKNLCERHGLIAQSITVGRSLNDPSN